MIVVAVVAQRFKDDGGTNFVAIVAGAMGIDPAAGLFGAIERWLFIGQGNKAQAASWSGVAEVTGYLEHGSDAAGIVVGAG